MANRENMLGDYLRARRGPVRPDKNGPSVTEVLRSVSTPTADAFAVPLSVNDLQPLTAGDSRGLSVFYSAFGVVLAVFLFGLTSTRFGVVLPIIWRAVSALACSLPAGGVIAWLEPLTAVLPVGVAVRPLRGAAYFQDDGVVVGIIVLIGWAVGAVALYGLGTVRQLQRARPRPAMT